ncbi:MAG: carboxypeptidase regulatory-like domain-containing protein [Bacteroidetes bacterium]|nr:carboxypeptidase regulatory-like domain-containing protein [Bacteroidota bacterium]
MKNLFRTLAAALLIFPMSAFAQDANTGDIKVTVTDEMNAPMPGAVVMIVAGGSTQGGATNMDGTITFRALNPGSYDLTARMSGYKKFTKTAVVVNAGQTAYTDFPMQLTTCDTCVIVIRDVKSPVDPTFSTLKNINADEIKTMAVDHSNLLSMITAECGDVQEGKGGQLVMRGSREGASTMYIDGEEMYGSTGIPGGAIEQVTVLSGGIPASFGDLTGGVVIITTKSYWTGASAKERMHEADAEAKAAAKKAMLEKEGKLKEDKNEIIEQSAPANGAH